MKKNVVRLTEGDLKNIIVETVTNLLKEGLYSNEDHTVTAWENLKDTVGAEAMLDAIYNYADDRTLKKYVGWMIDDFDLNLNEIYEYEDEEELEG